MIAVRGLAKSFDDAPVLAGIDLDVADGESLVVIGGSGAGKSVLLRSIMGLERPDAGTVRVEGRDPFGSDRAAFLDDLGVLFQGAALFDSLPVWQNVAFRLLRGRRERPRAAARDLAVAKLSRVGLGSSVADLYPAQLSGGMQKRVGLARAIATNPRVIFFDEPTAGLDPIMANVINDLIREVVVEMGATTITITHDLTTVSRVADRVAMLHGGVLRWTGAAHDMPTSDNPWLRQFIGGRTEGPIETLR
jgi:phospholipid/cholesterol/gamma-HCH transport system ATP-binding protein